MGLLRRDPPEPTSKPPLLFVHGAWHGAWCWEPFLLDWFAARGHVTAALDLTGHGARAGDLRRATLGTYVRDVADAARSLPSPPVVVGHSMGGAVVQHYLEGFGAPAGVLVATSPTHGAWQAAVRVARRAPAAFARVNAELRLGPIVEDRAVARWLLFRGDDDRPEVTQWLDRLGDESYLSFVGMLADLPRPGRVDAPLLVVAAEADRVFSVAEQAATAASHGAEFVIVPGAAHDVMLDPDWEVAAEAIADFVDRRVV
jgi:pimeloyl-ACP methyl ester carboxylesterase